MPGIILSKKNDYLNKFLTLPHRELMADDIQGGTSQGRSFVRSWSVIFHYSKLFAVALLVGGKTAQTLGQAFFGTQRFLCDEAHVEGHDERVPLEVLLPLAAGLLTLWIYGRDISRLVLKKPSNSDNSLNNESQNQPIELVDLSCYDLSRTVTRQPGLGSRVIYNSIMLNAYVSVFFVILSGFLWANTLLIHKKEGCIREKNTGEEPHAYAAYALGAYIALCAGAAFLSFTVRKTRENAKQFARVVTDGEFWSRATKDQHAWLTLLVSLPGVIAFAASAYFSGKSYAYERPYDLVLSHDTAQKLAIFSGINACITFLASRVGKTYLALLPEEKLRRIQQKPLSLANLRQEAKLLDGGKDITLASMALITAVLELGGSSLGFYRGNQELGRDIGLAAHPQGLHAFSGIAAASATWLRWTFTELDFLTDIIQRRDQVYKGIAYPFRKGVNIFRSRRMGLFAKPSKNETRALVDRELSPGYGSDSGFQTVSLSSSSSGNE